MKNLVAAWAEAYYMARDIKGAERLAAVIRNTNERIHELDNVTQLFNAAVAIADVKFDGHITIGKFTTGWQVFGHTPGCHEDWNKVKKFPSLEEALLNFIEYAPDIYEIDAVKDLFD